MNWWMEKLNVAGAIKNTGLNEALVFLHHPLTIG